MSKKLTQHLSNCEKFALNAALQLHTLRHRPDLREHIISDIMHDLLIIAEEARQGLKSNLEENEEL